MNQKGFHLGTTQSLPPHHESVHNCHCLYQLSTIAQLSLCMTILNPPLSPHYEWPGPWSDPNWLLLGPPCSQDRPLLARPVQNNSGIDILLVVITIRSLHFWPGCFSPDYFCKTLQDLNEEEKIRKLFYVWVYPLRIRSILIPHLLRS